MMRAPLTYIRRGCSETAAELVVVRDGVQVVAALTDADLERLARQALAVLPDRVLSAPERRSTRRVPSVRTRAVAERQDLAPLIFLFIVAGMLFALGWWGAA